MLCLAVSCCRLAVLIWGCEGLTKCEEHDHWTLLFIGTAVISMDGVGLVERMAPRGPGSVLCGRVATGSDALLQQTQGGHVGYAFHFRTSPQCWAERMRRRGARWLGRTAVLAHASVSACRTPCGHATGTSQQGTPSIC